MSRTPFAYSFSSDYGDSQIVASTLDALVGYFKANHWNVAYLVENEQAVTIHFDDFTDEPADLRAYLQENEVDRAEVEAYVDAAMKADRERYDASMEKARTEGRQLHTVTGSAPLFMCNRESVIQQEMTNRRYSWKGEPVVAVPPSHLGDDVAVYEKPL